MGKTRSELLSTASSSDITAAMAYYLIEPWGYPVESHQSGIIAATIANVNSKKTFTPSDFFYKLQRNYSSKAIFKKFKGIISNLGQ